MNRAPEDYIREAEESVGPVKCPYCHGHAEFLASSESVYHGKDYGPLWICHKCQAWCGCHTNTTRPLGRLADKELRSAKMAAHAAFDPHWKTQGFSRATSYKYLAAALGVDPDECHIGMFDVEMCRRVVEVCPLSIPTEKKQSGRKVGKAAQ